MLQFTISPTGDSTKREIYEGKKTTEMKEEEWVRFLLDPVTGMGESFPSKLQQFSIDDASDRFKILAEKYGGAKKIPQKDLDYYSELLLESQTPDTELIWYCDFTNDKKDAFRVIFIGRFYSLQYNLMDLRLHDEMFEKKIENYLLINPAIDSPDAQKTFSDLIFGSPSKNTSRFEFANVFIMKINDLINRYASDPKTNQTIRENWPIIQTKATTKILERYPFLLKALRQETLNFNDKHMKSAITKYELQNPNMYVDAIRDACIVVENIMRLLYEMYVDSYNKPRTFGDLLESEDNKLRDTIRTLFGEDVEKDVDYIAEVRNKISHPDALMKFEQTLTKAQTIKILNKCRNLYELFTLQINEDET